MWPRHGAVSGLEKEHCAVAHAVRVVESVPSASEAHAVVGLIHPKFGSRARKATNDPNFRLKSAQIHPLQAIRAALTDLCKFKPAKLRLNQTFPSPRTIGCSALSVIVARWQRRSASVRLDCCAKQPE